MRLRLPSALRFAVERCGRENPALEQVGSGHFAACFRSADLLASQDVAA